MWYNIFTMVKISLLKEIKLANFSWVHITHPTEIAARQLARQFPFLHEIDLKEILPPIQRPKLVEREKYLFIILLYPMYDRATRKIHAVEIDFFIGQDFLITASSEEFSPISEFFNRSKKEGANKGLMGLTTPAALLFELLKRLEHYCLPMSTHISNDIDRVENDVFLTTRKKETIDEVLRIKINIVNFKKSMNRHGRVLGHLAAKLHKLEPALPQEFLKGLMEDTEDLWVMLENYQDTVNAIHESQLSLLNFQSNAIMQIFTIFTTIIFTLELMIGVLGLAFDSSLSIVRAPMGFLAAMAGLAVVGLAMIIFFKRKNWV